MNYRKPPFLFMQKKLFMFFSALSLLIIQLVNADELFWHSSYAEAVADAKKTKKPIFLVFR